MQTPVQAQREVSEWQKCKHTALKQKVWPQFEKKQRSVLESPGACGIQVHRTIECMSSVWPSASTSDTSSTVGKKTTKNRVAQNRQRVGANWYNSGNHRAVPTKAKFELGLNFFRLSSKAAIMHRLHHLSSVPSFNRWLWPVISLPLPPIGPVTI